MVNSFGSALIRPNSHVVDLPWSHDAGTGGATRASPQRIVSNEVAITRPAIQNQAAPVPFAMGATLVVVWPVLTEAIIRWDCLDHKIVFVHAVFRHMSVMCLA